MLPSTPDMGGLFAEEIPQLTARFGLLYVKFRQNQQKGEIGHIVACKPERSWMAAVKKDRPVSFYRAVCFCDCESKYSY